MREFINADDLRQNLLALGAEPVRFQMSDDKQRSFEVFFFPKDNHEVIILYRFYDGEVEDCECGLFKSVVPSVFVQNRIDRKIKYLAS